jgi:D-glycero-D-manno-heptose 1,7-bisphosphate phosphatase
VPREIDAVFVDRDGTLNRKAPEGSYVRTAEEVVLLDGVGPALSRLNKAGIPVYLVTNQRGVARGVMSLDDVRAVNARLNDLLAASSGAWLDGIYVCPHGEGECDCRKPRPGLLLQCAADHPGLRLTHSVMIGDVESDVAAGLAAGTRTVLLAEAATSTAADFTAPDFAAAVVITLSGA